MSALSGCKHRICLCCGRRPARERLADVFNGWLSPDTIREARASAARLTEEQAQARLEELSREASHAYGMWENCQ